MAHSLRSISTHRRTGNLVLEYDNKQSLSRNENNGSDNDDDNEDTLSSLLMVCNRILPLLDDSNDKVCSYGGKIVSLKKESSTFVIVEKLTKEWIYFPFFLK